MGLNSELLEKAKQTGTAEELMAVAKENGVELTEEDAKEMERLQEEILSQLHISR